MATAGAVALVVPMVLTAGTASAQGAGTGSAFALKASGAITIGPLSAVNSESGPASAQVAGYQSPDGSLVTGVLEAQAGPGWAEADVANLDLKIGGQYGHTVTASVLKASCNGGEGSANIAGLTIDGQSHDISLPANTGISVAGVEVLFNKQVDNGDGTSTISALSIKVPGESIDIASTTCGCPTPTATPTPPPETTTPPATTPSAPAPSSPSGGTAPEAPAPTPAPGHIAVTG